MNDVVLHSARQGHLVLWEEVARDGAQAKTLLLGSRRVALARAQGALFGAHGPQHLIFAAGFPAVCPEEFDAVREVVTSVDNCSVACHGRSNRDDMDICLRAIAGARYGRITLIVPMSDRLAQALLHRPMRAAIEHVLEIVRYTLDRSGGIPIDAALMDASHADPAVVAETAMALSAAGVSVIKLCDSMGELYPRQIRAFVSEIKARVSPGVVLGVHLHNDLGLALANNLEAVAAGVRVVSGSWLGLGERNGLAPTEQLLFALSYQEERLGERIGCDGPLWQTRPNLRQIVPLAREVSQATGVPLKVTDPLVGTGLNAFATGTAFLAPHLFRPFDPEAVLGVPQRVQLTQLANARIVHTVAESLGYTLSAGQTVAAVRWVKSYAFTRGEANVPTRDFALFLSGLLAHEQVVMEQPLVAANGAS